MNARILILDDDEDIVEIITRWLEDRGYPVVVAASTLEAINVALEQTWDLVISDVYLVGRNGIDIARQIKALQTRTAVMLMTGHVTTELTLEALDCQVDGFVSKPMARNELLDKVEKLLSARRVDGIEQKEQVLAIGAHPDDVEIGCGGALLKHRRAGDAIQILTLSSGQAGGDRDIRYAESLCAADQLGATLEMGDLTDTKISEGPETISAIHKIVQSFRPTIIYTHTINDCHQDHRNVHRATIVAARNIASIHAYQSPSSSIDFKPTKFLDIGDMLESKQRLIGCYASQVSKCRYLNPSMIRSTAEYWGRFSGYQKVEPFEVIRSC